ncbi:hypothetical protein [Lentimicrobium sp. S6]|uniref:hypothetical protein n=1 Tax=Lentimicrobium sp. S6 TaxID=2735872 RepID=UPI0015544E28|nr:hypothetical protein [Lentimicrobium sp. S6]NPD46326.1 hypothetical protein [Lentimicrobium sp. S6]
MDKKQDVEMLFNEKFSQFSPELSPDALTTLDAKLKTAMYFRWAKYILMAGIIAVSSWLVYEALQNEELSNEGTHLELPLSNTQNTITKSVTKEENAEPTAESQMIDSPKISDEEMITLQEEQSNPLQKNEENISETIIVDSEQKEIISSSENHKEPQAILLDEELDIEEKTSSEILIAPELTNESEEKTKENTKPETPIFEENESISLEEAIQETLAEELGIAVSIEIGEESALTSEESNTSIDGNNKEIDSKDKKKTKPKKKAKKTKFAKTTDRSAQGTKTKKLNAFLDIHVGGFMFDNTASSPALYSDSLTSTAYTQTPQLSYEFGMGFQLKLKDKPWLLYTGIDYQVFKEKIDYKWSQSFEDIELSYWNYDSTFSIEQVIDTFYIIVDTNHFVIDTIFRQDTLLSHVDSTYNKVMSTDENSKKYTNTYTYLNIPLMIGYEFKTHNKKWSFQVLGGAAIALNLSNEGYYYSKDGGIQEYSGKVNPSLTWRLMAAANINYQWKKWQFYIQPEYQYQLNESQVLNQDMRRKYQLYKVKAGIRFKLF